MIQLKGLKPTRTGFGEGVCLAAESNQNLLVLGSDITESVGLGDFKKQFPDRFLSLGIAEQNAMAVAAGLALSGKIPVLSTYAVFSAFRSADQLRVSVAYNNVHVIIGGAHAGISVGPDGATHQALEDMALIRTIPNITLLSPCDATQTKLAVIAAINQATGPCYIRYGREAIADYTPESLVFKIGKAQVFKEGNDISIFASGALVWESMKAADSLEEIGISAQVINFHTIKPLDVGQIIQSAKKTGCILCAEEHQVHGGFGSAVAEAVVKSHPVIMDFIGVNNTFGESGQPGELMEKFGLDAKNIFAKAKQLVEKKSLSNKV